METTEVKAHIPMALKNISQVNLNKLKNFLETEGESIFKNFIKEAIENVGHNFKRRKPSGNSGADYHQWGYYQGLSDGHKFYYDLLDMIKLEKKTREQDGGK